MSELVPTFHEPVLDPLELDFSVASRRYLHLLEPFLQELFLHLFVTSVRAFHELQVVVEFLEADRLKDSGLKVF